jgi:hypothetical protein
MEGITFHVSRILAEFPPLPFDALKHTSRRVLRQREHERAYMLAEPPLSHSSFPVTAVVQYEPFFQINVN